MRAYIVTTIIGTFALDESNKIVSFIPFPRDFEKIAEKLIAYESEVIEEEKKIQSELSKKGFTEFIFPFKKSGVKIFETENKAETFIRENLRKLAIEKGFVKDDTEFNQFLSRIGIELTKLRIKKALSKDKLVVQVNNAIEELDKTINIFIERIREWYSLHFPEMDRIISSHERYVKIIKDFGSREKIADKDLAHFKEKSMGLDFSQEDVKSVQEFAKLIIQLFETREKLAKYLEKLLKEVAPNFSELATPPLAAKFISKAGSLEKLAKMPSSTIQLLGAEKSLFRFLHGKGKSPKYGLLFQHPYVQKAPLKLRGKVARHLAAKLSMAVRIDFYSKEYKADKLKKEVEEEIRKILTKERG
ncbi:MAG: C/D box methylation guide ribonucleoprotein complex aNOP56 subunit [Candidatus Aenigmarchaeota archaeon]|nr:C/D box methylation guide ribonucleoprotein complex aNOP56 subunit [Candidatus Aenigmarchaeota archaeon]